MEIILIIKKLKIGIIIIKFRMNQIIKNIQIILHKMKIPIY